MTMSRSWREGLTTNYQCDISGSGISRCAIGQRWPNSLYSSLRELASSYVCHARLGMEPTGDNFL